MVINMNLKKIIAGSFSLLMCASVCSCGSGSSSKTDEDSFTPTENVKVEPTDKVSDIPADAEKELIYLGLDDINPTKANPEKKTELALFEQKGGSIKYQQTTYIQRFETLAAAILSKKDVPDMTNYEWLSFPAHSVANMHQPIDDIVNFDDELWADVKDDAQQYSIGDKHYVAPLAYEASAMMCYDHAIVESESLDDPYELYLEGEWNWDNWASIMEEYKSNAPDGTDRYGINGFFKQHITQQTGKTLVNYDPATYTFTSNLNDPDIEAAQNLLYDLNKQDLIISDWIGNAREAFKQGCLFYAMGDWGYSANNTPKESDDWRIVPIPAYTKNPQKITTSDMTAYMWVEGSTKNDAMKCWLECCRVTYTDPDYKETNKQKFMENNPYWTDDMYDVKMDVISDDYYMIYDYAYGISTALGDPNGFDGNNSLTDTLYISSSKLDEDGLQPSWTQVREKYSAVVESEIATINKKIAELAKK